MKNGADNDDAGFTNFSKGPRAHAMIERNCYVLESQGWTKMGPSGISQPRRLALGSLRTVFRPASGRYSPYLVVFFAVIPAVALIDYLSGRIGC
ncbi:hypothetical protein [Bradyrhizobium sp. Ai1a-2]|uniref:hypothetical protein n=1 Tax=Bradyrhizobium sp. Ai1a-2 TaxID=196490 RepID=UPI0012678FE5|nr:hypothetical protein [Bradyrhizobium sp. Ai1a-2]